MHHVVAKESKGQHTTTVRTRVACGRVQCLHVKAHNIAGLELPPKHVEAVGSGGDIGKFGKRPFGKPLRLCITKGSRHVPRAVVRAGNEFK